jgi:uncharacterized membrane protein YkoI
VDSKIILAILIVALIGVVAATYNGQTNDAINTLSSVATEDTPTESVTDSVETADGSTSDSSLTIDESTVKPDSKTSTKKTTSKKTTDKKTSTKTQTTTNKKISNPTNTQNSARNKPVSIETNNTQQKLNISLEEAKSIALSQLPEKFKGATVSQPKLTGQYYEVSFTKNNQIIGYYEIDANTGKITGGAFVDEVKP